MNRPFGISFQPGQLGAGAAPDPMQTAIQLLSLRLPTTAAPGGIAPQALLQGAGGAGIPGATGGTPNGDVLAMLRRLLAMSGGDSGASGGGMAPMGSGGGNDQGGGASPSAPGDSAAPTYLTRIIPDRIAQNDQSGATFDQNQSPGRMDTTPQGYAPVPFVQPFNPQG